MLDGPITEDGQIRGAASDIEQCHPKFHLIPRENGLGRGNRFQNYFGNIQAGPVTTGYQIVERGHVCSHDMYIGYQPYPGHPQGILDTGMIINHVFLGQDMDDLLVIGYFNGLGRLDHSIDFLLPNLLIVDGDDPGRVKALDMTAGNADIDGLDVTTGHVRGAVNGLANSPYR